MDPRLSGGVKISCEGQVALVVGGSGGIGESILSAFKDVGAAVHCFDVRPPQTAGVEFVETDVTNPAAVQAAVDQVATAAGGLDHVVYCAGITRDKVLWKLDAEAWDAVIGVNLTGAFHVVKAATPHLRARKAGSIVLIASINGERGKRGQANYAASKGGLIAFGKTAARELGYFGVRVNVVAPGFIETPMTAKMPEEAIARARDETVLGRTGKPEDVANVVVFLASGLAAHITGQVVRVDGGQLIV